MKEIVLLLTACVSPNCNNAERRKQYVDALKWYLYSTKCHIIFCKNLGIDLFEKINNKKDQNKFLTKRSEEFNHFNCTRG